MGRLIRRDCPARIGGSATSARWSPLRRNRRLVPAGRASSARMVSKVSVANVVQACAVADDRDLTLDLRVLELFPELSSRDLNHLINPTRPDRFGQRAFQPLKGGDRLIETDRSQRSDLLQQELHSL